MLAQIMQAVTCQTPLGDLNVSSLFKNCTSFFFSFNTGVSCLLCNLPQSSFPTWVCNDSNWLSGWTGETVRAVPRLQSSQPSLVPFQSPCKKRNRRERRLAALRRCSAKQGTPAAFNYRRPRSAHGCVLTPAGGFVLQQLQTASLTLQLWSGTSPPNILALNLQKTQEKRLIS